MLNQDRAQEVFTRIKKFSTVDEVEVIFSSTHYALTRFANNTIHQNVSELTDSASIRVAFDGKTARATTNRFDDEGLKRLVVARAVLPSNATRSEEHTSELQSRQYLV